MEGKLSARQQRFVEEYLLDPIATQAAIRAGYSERTAGVQGCRLLNNANVSRAIAEGQKARSEKAKIDAQWVLANLVEVSQRCLQKAPVMEFSPADRCMVQAEDEEGRPVWEFDSKGANRALELIGKHLGMFIERVEVKDVTPLADKVAQARQRMKERKTLLGGGPVE